MEPEGAALETSWNSFDAAMLAEESETIAHLLGDQRSPYELDQDPSIGMPPMFWPDHGSDLYYCLDFETNDNPYHVSQGRSSTSTSSFSLPLANNVGCCLSDSNGVLQISTCSTPMDFSIGEGQIIAPSLPTVSYHQFSELICATKEAGSDEFRGSKEKSSVPVVPPHQTSRAIEKRFHAGEVEQPMTNEKCGTSIECPKKKDWTSARR
ncbi:putative transcription factor bHLH85-like [Cocos nucifera]|uniref:Putative transcription factor bHLH85-like n=1 Tax=Cocos nucifera TaxID=13894 RepID=A0A8K0ITH6_COCNU|nr:putative transcription factor bHLH85-like [Cocos nucifera]